jgi:renalase
MKPIDVLIVGAGWTGLTAASLLKAAGREVVVVDKARGPGGRSSTRRQDGFSFDHGAQYLTARDEGFRAQVEAWRDLGLIATWQPRIRVVGARPGSANGSPDQRLVGVPGMSAVLHYLASHLDCRFGEKVAKIEWSDDHWTLVGERGDRLSARNLVLTPPPQQTASLLGSQHPLYAQVSAVPMAPAWALLLAFNMRTQTEFDAVFVNEGPLGWIARNSDKPGRQGNVWLVHASQQWSQENLERDPEDVAEEMLDAFNAIVNFARSMRPAVATAHRWRYALCTKPLDCGAVAYPRQNLVIAGDWCAGNRIEGAWLSGRAAAGVI